MIELINLIEEWFCNNDKMTLKDYHNIKVKLRIYKNALKESSRSFR